MTALKRSNKRRRPWWSVVLFSAGALGVMMAECAVRVSPEVIPFLGAAGVVFPGSWCLLLIGTFGAFRSRKWTWFAVGIVLLIVSIPHARSTWGIPSMPDSKATPGSQASLRVLSWNVRQFNRFAWIGVPGVQDSILALMERSDADVICIQETYLEATSGREARKNPWMSRDILKAATGMPYLMEEIDLGRGSDKLFGLVVLSRYPLMDKQSLKFENDRNNSAMSVDVNVDGDTIRVFNVHLSSIGFEEADYEDARNVRDEAARMRILHRLQNAWAKRAPQARQVAESVCLSPHPVILAGDFNDTPVSYASEQMAECLVDGYTRSGIWNMPALGGTYQGELPFLRIDQMWHSPIFECVSYKTIDVALSDHRPVLGEFVLHSSE